MRTTVRAWENKVIKTVIFDLDDTMYDYTEGNRRALLLVRDYCYGQLGISEAEFQTVIKQAGSRIVERLGFNSAAIHNRLIRYQCMMEMLGRPLFPHAEEMCKIYWDALICGMVPQPGLPEFLADIKKRGIFLGIGTNMTADYQFRKLNRLQVTPFVDWIVTSEEAGAEKPDRRFYQCCMEKAACRPEECLFIGDSLTGDVKAPIEYGMKALWYHPGRQSESDGDFVQEYKHIQSFSECLNDEFWDSF